MNREEQIKKAHEFLSDGNFEEARSLVEAIKKHDAEHKPEDKKEPEVKESEVKKEPEVKESEVKKELEVKESDVKEPEIKKEQEEKEVKKEKRSFEPKGEEINMEKVVMEGSKTENNEVRGFLNYLRSKQTGNVPESRALPADLAGMKSAQGAAIIPEEIITKAKMLPETVYDLRKYITTQKVSHAVGKYPILKSNQAKLASVDELLKNPDLEAPQFTEVTYEVDTYRGQLAVAQEALDDSDDDLAGIIARHIQRQAPTPDMLAIPDDHVWPETNNQK